MGYPDYKAGREGVRINYSASPRFRWNPYDHDLESVLTRLTWMSKKTKQLFLEMVK